MMRLPGFMAIAILATACASASVHATAAQCVILVSFCCLVAQGVYVLMAAAYYAGQAVCKPLVVAPEEHKHRVVVVSMYAAGSAVYLALPALCMWDLHVTLAFLGVLTLTSMLDAPKYVDFTQTSVDTARAVQHLRRVHLSLHTCALAAQGVCYCLVPCSSHSLVMVLFAMCSPLLLRALSWMRPLHVLEMGLPVSSLWSIVVLCWYMRQSEDLLFLATEGDMLGFLVVCPFSLATLLGCILHGFRQSAGVLAVVGLTVTVAARYHHMATELWPIVVSQLVMLALAGYLGFEQHRTGATLGSKKVYVAAVHTEGGEGQDTAIV